jgi:preprotein translocase subunit SecD
MTAIIDSNVTTALTATMMYSYGPGPVKGFAVTLIAGILASMVTSIFVVRTFYIIWLSRTRAPQTISI